MELKRGVGNANGGASGFSSYDAKSFTITGAQTDYNVATQQTMFTTTYKQVMVKCSAAATVKLNSSSGAGILFAAGEQITFDNFPVSNLFITTTVDCTVRVVAFK